MIIATHSAPIWSVAAVTLLGQGDLCFLGWMASAAHAALQFRGDLLHAEGAVENGFIGAVHNPPIGQQCIQNRTLPHQDSQWPSRDEK